MARTPDSFKHALVSPSLLLAGLEPARATLEFARGLGPNLSVGHLKGQQAPVVVIPGLATGHQATYLLRKKLRDLDYDVHDWGLGLNTGPRKMSLPDWLAPLSSKLRELHRYSGQKVTLIGWSLGGLVARELAKDDDTPVARVVTLGTPVRAFMSATNVAWLYDLLNKASPHLSEAALAALEVEPSVPCISIFSQADGVVNWKACVQRNALRTKHIMLTDASHLGMTVNPLVFEAIVRELHLPLAGPKS